MKSTKNYSQFKSIVSNREVDERHVNQLMKAIEAKNLLHLNPIICNKEFEVVDGQHRLEAASRLGLEVYYIMDDQVSKADIATINSHAKNWKVMDYINYWTIEKRPGFDRLSAFLSENPQIPPSTALMMLSVDASRQAHGVREGHINTGNHKEANEIATVLRYYRNLIDFAYDRNFVLAVYAAFTSGQYDHEIMKKKLEYQSRSLVKCINTKQYLPCWKRSTITRIRAKSPLDNPTGSLSGSRPERVQTLYTNTNMNSIQIDTQSRVLVDGLADWFESGAAMRAFKNSKNGREAVELDPDIRDLTDEAAILVGEGTYSVHHTAIIE